MENTDQQILSLLAEDGRMSFTDIGKETGLSISAAQQRVRRLEQKGIIKGYRAEISPEAFGRILKAVITVKPINPSLDDQVPAIVEQMDEVISCYSVAGAASYLLIAQVHDPNELDSLLNRIRTQAQASTVTTLVLNTYFQNRIPIDGEDI